ncbi:hypothetical protein H5410_011942, partial [Solanum commersonii]
VLGENSRSNKVLLELIRLGWLQSSQIQAFLWVFNKGHVVTKKSWLPALLIGKGCYPFWISNQYKTSKRIHFVRSLIREVAGFAPYEKRITELLKVGKDKRALKVAKRKLGTHKRAKKKREEMSSVLRKMRATGGGERRNELHANTSL